MVGRRLEKTKETERSSKGAERPGRRRPLTDEFSRNAYCEKFSGSMEAGESKQVGGYSFTVLSVMSDGIVLDVKDASNGKIVAESEFIEQREKSILQEGPLISVGLQIDEAHANIVIRVWNRPAAA
jgi:hypothetical protein